MRAEFNKIPYTLYFEDYNHSHIGGDSRFAVWEQADAFVVMYSISSAQSFQEMGTALSRVVQLRGNSDCLILVGNKADLEKQREVTKQAGADLAATYSCSHFEISARTKEGLSEVVDFLVPKLFARRRKLETEKTNRYCTLL